MVDAKGMKERRVLSRMGKLRMRIFFMASFDFWFFKSVYLGLGIAIHLLQ